VEPPRDRIPRHLVVFGRPGSGKSSLADRLVTEVGFRIVRTGEMLREAVRRADPLGQKVSSLLAAGELVPDPLIYEVLEDSLFAPDTERLLFDGFPRTVGQIPDLDRLEDRFGFQVGLYIEIAVSAEAATERMTGRRVCSKCAKTYHVTGQPPKVEGVCDLDGAPLTRRSDDTLEVVSNRQRLYADLTDPVVRFYQATYPSRFVAVNGEQPFDAVYRDLRRAVLGNC
jgi:adenylate kinase